VQFIAMLAVSVVLSSYERRSMALLHNRDAPIAYLLMGLGQPIGDGGKLLMKSLTSTTQYQRYVVVSLLSALLASTMTVASTLVLGYSSYWGVGTGYLLVMVLALLLHAGSEIPLGASTYSMYAQHAVARMVLAMIGTEIL